VLLRTATFGFVTGIIRRGDFAGEESSGWQGVQATLVIGGPHWTCGQAKGNNVIIYCLAGMKECVGSLTKAAVCSLLGGRGTRGCGRKKGAGRIWNGHLIGNCGQQLEKY
jgi:hypothetical protein